MIGLLQSDFFLQWEIPSFYREYARTTGGKNFVGDSNNLLRNIILHGPFPFNKIDFYCYLNCKEVMIKTKFNITISSHKNIKTTKLWV